MGLLVTLLSSVNGIQIYLYSSPVIHKKDMNRIDNDLIQLNTNHCIHEFTVNNFFIEI